MERFFTVESSEINVTGGRYKAKSPYNAAAKAARMLFREQTGKKTKIRFVIRETTREGSGKTFEYIGIKSALAEPKVVVRGDSKITITHSYSVKSCKV
jgi:hypothetical protein